MLRFLILSLGTLLCLNTAAARTYEQDVVSDSPMSEIVRKYDAYAGSAEVRKATLKRAITLADQGDRAAEYLLGSVNLELGNDDEAEKWLTRAAAQNLVDADLGLATLYMKQKNYLHARRHALKARVKFPRADGILGFIARQEGDKESAMNYYMRCAEFGDEICQCRIGDLYMEAKNLPAARDFYNRSCDGGYEEGCRALKALEAPGR